MFLPGAMYGLSKGRQSATAGPGRMPWWKVMFCKTSIFKKVRFPNLVFPVCQPHVFLLAKVYFMEKLRIGGVSKHIVFPLFEVSVDTPFKAARNDTQRPWFYFPTCEKKLHRNQSGAQ